MFELTIEDAGNFVRVYLKGQHSALDATQFGEAVAGLAAVSSGRVILHVDGVEAATPHVCKAVMDAAHSLHAKEVRLAVCGQSTGFASLLAQLPYDGFGVFASEDEAAHALWAADREAVNMRHGARSWELTLAA